MLILWLPEAQSINDTAQAACDIAVFVFRVHDVAMDPRVTIRSKDFLLDGNSLPWPSQ